VVVGGWDNTAVMLPVTHTGFQIAANITLPKARYLVFGINFNYKSFSHCRNLW